MACKFCPGCGAPYNGDERFCGKCGYALPYEQPVSQAPVVEQPMYQAPVVEQPVYQAPVVEQPPVVEQTPIVEQPVYQPAPVPQQAPEEPYMYAKKPKAPREKKPVNPKLLADRGTGAAVLSTFLCIFLCLSLFATLFLAGIRTATSAAGSKKLLKETLTDEEFLDMDSSAITGEDTDGTVGDWIIETVTADYEGKKPREKALIAFMEESALIDLLCEQAGDLVETLRGSGDTEEVDTKDLKRALKKDRDLIEDTFKITLSDADIDHVVEGIEDSGLLETLQMEGIRDNSPELVDILDTVFSDTILIICIAVCILFAALIALVNRFNVIYIGKDLGISAIIAGFAMCVPSIVFPIVIKSLDKSVEMWALISKLLKVIFASFLTTGIIVMVIGVVLVAGMITFKILLKKRAAVAQ